MESTGEYVFLVDMVTVASGLQRSEGFASGAGADDLPSRRPIT